jgi:hypothetical protein
MTNNGLNQNQRLRILRGFDDMRISIRGVRLLVLLLLSMTGLAATGCTDLDESPTSFITPDGFYTNEQEVIAGLASVYATTRNTLWGYYNLSQVSSDETIVPTRGQDWFDNGRWIEIHQQAWNPNSTSALDDINGTWNDLFGGIARANVVLDALTRVTVPNQGQVEAELRALRGFYYYLLMDMFGGVPIVTDLEIMPRERASRAELFNFIETELNAARGSLPASWPADMHGRMTQGAVDAILASMYLNAEVFTGTVSTGGLQPGTARWQDAIDAADRVINSGTYSLATDWRSNFEEDNYLSSENILVAKTLNEVGLGLNFLLRALHYNSLSQGPSPWNGFATLAETYYAFDQDDDRIDIFLVGPQVDLSTGEPINDRSGNPLVFVPEIGDITQATEGEGARIVKFPPDPNNVAENHGNDMTYFRLAEMYLIKAEAMNELGMTAAAVDIVNMIRERVFDPDEPLNAADFNQDTFRDRILQERLFELTAEAKRRQDLIRHGQYTTPWAFKDQVDPYRILMPIPQTQIDTNPLLVQNPGY